MNIIAVHQIPLPLCPTRRHCRVLAAVGDNGAVFLLQSHDHFHPREACCFWHGAMAARTRACSADVVPHVTLSNRNSDGERNVPRLRLSILLGIQRVGEALCYIPQGPPFGRGNSNKDTFVQISCRTPCSHFVELEFPPAFTIR